MRDGGFLGALVGSMELVSLWPSGCDWAKDLQREFFRVVCQSES